MTVALLNSFPKNFGLLTGFDSTTQRWEVAPRGFSGFQFSKQEFTYAFENGLRELFFCLLMHDKIILRYDDFIRCIKALGPKNIILLMQENALSVVFDCQDFAFLDNGGGLELTTLTKRFPLEDLLNGYVNIKSQNKKVQSKLRELTDLKKIVIKNKTSYADNDDEKKIISEVSRDFLSEDFVDSLGVSSETPDLVKKSMKLRLCEVIQGFLLQRKTGAESIIQDAISERYLKNKITLNPISLTNTEGFQYLLKEKGVPDLFDLFKKKIISIDDVIRMRESGQAATFRRWLKENDYDKDKMVSTLLKSKSRSIKSTITRFLYPTIIGAFNPPLGVAASAIDSFVVSGLIENWQPEVYLDKKIASVIEKKESDFTEARLLELRKKHGLRGPFDECYCGSGKVFSKCHGKIW